MIEAMVSVSIFAIVIGAVFTIFSIGMSSWEIGEAKTKSQEGARTALQRMVQEIRLSNSAHIEILDDSGIRAYSGSRIRFQRPFYSGQKVQLNTTGSLIWGSDLAQNQWISYEVIVPEGKTTGQLVRKVLGPDKIMLSQRILANNIKCVEFSGVPNLTYSPNSIQIIITGNNPNKGSNMSSVLKSRVWLRN